VVGSHSPFTNCNLTIVDWSNDSHSPFTNCKPKLRMVGSHSPFTNCKPKLRMIGSHSPFTNCNLTIVGLTFVTLFGCVCVPISKDMSDRVRQLAQLVVEDEEEEQGPAPYEGESDTEPLGTLGGLLDEDDGSVEETEGREGREERVERVSEVRPRRRRTRASDDVVYDDRLRRRFRSTLRGADELREAGDDEMDITAEIEAGGDLVDDAQRIADDIGELQTRRRWTEGGFRPEEAEADEASGVRASTGGVREPWVLPTWQDILEDQPIVAARRVPEPVTPPPSPGPRTIPEHLRIDSPPELASPDARTPPRRRLEMSPVPDLGRSIRAFLSDDGYRRTGL